MTDVPIVKVGSNLIATVHEDLSDAEALSFQEALTARLEQSDAVGVLIDLTFVRMIDSFLGRLLRETALGARLLGAETVVAGMQPVVAMTLVELGLGLEGIRTTLTPERGLELLNRRLGGPRGRRRGV